ncbi:MAG: plasmid pRiA4b ORF-3 family protein [Deltaproteobacteria bacterium]|jgi:hypothetical protein|nr:plasmid pRiA4b ORF-3 family protein [Deltaproteobacteria bacterium]
MQILVSNKLAKFLKLPKLPAPSKNGDPFFSWRGRIFAHKESSYLVLINLLTNFTIFAKNPDWGRNLAELFINNLCYAAGAEKINLDLLSRYMMEGDDLKLVRNFETREDDLLNKAVEQVCFKLSLIDDKSLALGMEAKVLYENSEVSWTDYDLPETTFVSQLKQYKEPNKGRMAFELNVRLDLDGHDAIRKLRVPADITFRQLHKILQKSFCWVDYHLHSFGLFRRWSKSYYARPDIELMDDEDEDVDVMIGEILGFDVGSDAIIGFENKKNTRPEKNVKLTQYLPKYNKIIYEYDFGDSWRHYIELEKVIDLCTDKLPVLISGHGDAPPEDVGGSTGFERFKKIIKNPSHPDYDFYINWAKDQRWRPFNFNSTAKRVSRSLKKR